MKTFLKIKKKDLDPSYNSIIGEIWGHRVNDAISLILPSTPDVIWQVKGLIWSQVWDQVQIRIHRPILDLVLDLINENIGDQ